MITGEQTELEVNTTTATNTPSINNNRGQNKQKNPVAYSLTNSTTSGTQTQNGCTGAYGANSISTQTLEPDDDDIHDVML